MVKIVDVIISTLNNVCYRLKKEKKNMLKKNKIFGKFLLVYVEGNMKKIVKNQLWKNIISTVIFYYGDLENGSYHGLTEILWINKLSKELQEEYIRQSIIGLRAYSAITRDKRIETFANHFEEQIRYEIKTFG